MLVVKQSVQNSNAMKMLKSVQDMRPISFLESMMLFMELWRSEMLYLLARRLADRVMPLVMLRSDGVLGLGM